MLPLNLLTKFNQAKSPPPEQFLALSLGSETVHSAVWQIDKGDPRIVSLGSIEEWNGDETKLIAAADTSLSTALEPIEKEPDKIIFGLPESFVVDDKIAPERQTLLKDLSEKLTLKPIGFVVITEAIIHWLKTKEGTPATTILLELSETEVIVTLVKVGKSLGSKTVGRSEDLGADVEEGLARFAQTDTLPSRMIVYDGHLDLESARQTLLSYPWQDKLPFLHFPKIELLDKDVVIRAISLAGGNDSNLTNTTALEPPPSPPPTAADIGFSNTDVITPPSPLPQSHFPSKLSNLVHQARLRITALKLKRLPLISAGVVALLTIMIISATVAYWTLPQANITLYLTPKIISQTLQFTVDAGRDTDKDKKRLHGNRIELEVEDSLQKDTTGESEVGDKATGEITLYNKTSSSKKLSSGTILLGPSSLQFSLDKDVTIASQSATDTGITFGKTVASVTSAQVGNDSNLSADTPLTLKGFDPGTYSAKTNIAFTGGSSRTVRAVSKFDHESLLEELTNKLTIQALDTLNTQTESDQTIIDKSPQTEIVSKKYTKAIGEEADTVSLTMKLRVTTLKFDTTELLALTQSQSASDQVDIKFEDVDYEDNQAAVTATINKKLIPEINTNEIIGNLRGKYPQDTESYLKSLPNFAKVEIEFSPKLPKKLATFPKRAQNIHLVIKGQN